MRRLFYRNMLRYLILSVSVLTILITCEKPERVVQFTTLEAQTTDISYTTATLKGEITDAGSKPIGDHGILVSTDANPRVGNATVKSLGSRSSKGVFSVNVTELTKNTTYYFRSYVTIEGVDTYAEKICSFTTKDTEAPTVTAGTITALTMTSASLNGEVTSDGGESAVTRGLCWGSEANPTISNCIDTTVNGSGTGVYTGSMTDLTPGTQYYARTYATNSKGTSYNSADIVFTTHGLPVVTTASVTEITETTATSGGEVTDEGGVDVTARGICWSTTSGPTVDLATKTTDGTGEGAFVSSVTGLTQGTKYYLRAYATNQYGTSYGSETSFTTSSSTEAPSATTISAGAVASTSALLQGTVNANGYSTTVTFEYGLTTSYGTELTADQSPVTGTTETAVNVGVTGLSEGTIYHYRVKAVSSGGTTYGDDMTFTTTSTTGAPSATTESATSVTTTSATLNGTVNANDLSTTVTFEYGETTAYGSEITANESPVTGSTNTAVTGDLSSLTASTTYHYRVKAVSTGGTTYGDDIEFTTSAALPTVTDYDGNMYDIITIGTQDWIQENLKTTHYNNGDAIANITGNTEWEALTSGAYCWYDNDEGTYKDTYGALYNWYTAVEVRNVCPAGWHVPTDAEWTTLTDFLGGESVAGGKLKEIGTTHWTSPNTDATNETGFTALPGGYRNDAGSFYSVNYYGYWWSSTEYNTTLSWYRGIYYNSGETDRIGWDKPYGLSIRCVKGELPLAQAEDATTVTAISAILNGQVNPNNASTTVTFEYGETTSYGSEATASESPVTGTTPVSVSAGISSLSESTTYHYRVKAVNSYGTTYSTDTTFTTLQLPDATTGSATSITGTTATLDGTVNANDLSTTVTFEYGETTAYGSEVTANESPVTGSTNTAVTADLSGLTESTTYHYRIKAVSAGGTTYGDDMTFTTLTPPSATTASATLVASTLATLNGTVNANDQSTSVTFEYGITTSYGNEIAADQNPVTGNTTTAVSVDLGSLTASTTYHYRVKAVSSGGTIYGNDMTFTTTEQATDADGNAYNTIQIGPQLWTLENLKTTHYTTSDAITNITDNSEWAAATSGVYCWFDNDEGTYKDTYGARYNWYTTVDVRNLCPAGWHVPTDAEWTILTDYLGGLSVAGGKLKETGTEHWTSPNTDATNETGFTALPGGYRNEYGIFSNLRCCGYWWTSSKDSETNAFDREMSYTSNSIDRVSMNKKYGFSVRCIKGELPLAQADNATVITAISATLNGQVNPNNASTTVTFEYGLTISYGSEATASESPVTGATPVPVSAGISSLSESTTYHYRIKAVNSYGTTYSADMSFTTLTPPTATTGSATSITGTTATLNGTVNANDLSTTVTFEYGETTAYGSEVTANESPVTGSTNTAVTGDLSSLTASTTYHYRVKAVSAAGTTYGDDMTFTTLTPPSATTGSATAVTSISATLNGTVNANDLSTTVTFEYGLTTGYGSEVTADESPVTGTTSTAVSYDLTGLTASTTYHYRVKAVSSGGTTYGDDMTFTTTELVTDADGNTYNTVQIGTQLWTMENLKTTHYTTGDVIANVTGNTEWEALTSGAYCWYDNDEGTYKDTYGALYNWYTTIDVRNVCPAGWHMPTDAEWTTLSDYLGGESIAGGKLKETGTSHWTTPNTDATNETGFTALPGGYRNDAGSFYSVNYYGYWWSCTESNATLSLYRALYYNSSEANRSIWDKPYGFSIRCIKGELPLVQTDTAIAVASESATLKGIVNPNQASTTVTFEYGTTTAYGSTVTADQSPASGSDPVNVSAGLTSLTPGTTYHYRIKAENSGGTNYGSDMEFTTPEQVSDVDGNTYNTVIIGTQTWMQENLKTTKYNNNSSIPLVTNATTWSGLTTPGFCWYNNLEGTYGNIYGALYNWYAINTGILCPTGWHVPSDGEFTTLIDNLGGSDIAGKKLKEEGNTHWDSSNGDNSSGYTALPGGRRSQSDGSFMHLGTGSYLWSADEALSTTAKNMIIMDSIDEVFQSVYDKKNGHSVRCLKDE